MIPFLRRTIHGTVPDFLAPMLAKNRNAGSRNNFSTTPSAQTLETKLTPNSNFNSTSTAAIENSVGNGEGLEGGRKPKSRDSGSTNSRTPSRRSGSTSSNSSSSSSNSKTRSSRPNEQVRRKPLHNQTTLAPSNNQELDPFSLVSQIRSLAPPQSPLSNSNSSFPSKSTKKDRIHSPPFKSNDIHAVSLALKNLQAGLQPQVVSFDLAFVQGWKKLKSAGYAGRITRKELGLLIEIGSTEITRNGGKSKEISWVELKELIMWSAGDPSMPGIPNWAWSSLVGGSDIGAERVVEVWESFMRGEPTKSRTGEATLDRFSKPDFPSKVTSPEDRDRAVIDPSLYAAYIVARSILHTSATFHQRFVALLPELIGSSSPSLIRFVGRTKPTLRETLEITFTGSSTPVTAILKAEAWLRQIQLANTWLRTGKGNGLGVILAINQAFKRSDPKVAVGYWVAVKEGVEDIDIGWIGDKWEATKGDHLLEGMSKTEALGEIPGEQEELVEGAAPNKNESFSTYTSEVSTPVPVLAPKVLAPRPSEAYFTEAFLAPFLVGFVRAKMYDQATEIWNWLGNPNAPLIPGVVSWTALLRGYTASGDTEAAEAVFSQMQAAGITPDSIAWIHLVDGYFKSKNVSKAVELLGKMFTNKELRQTLKEGKFEEEIYRKILAGFLSAGRVEEAESVLKEMVDEGVLPTIHSYNLFIRHYTSRSKADFPNIVKTLRLISEQGLQADVFTFTMVLKGLLTVSQSDAVAKLVSIMENSGVKPTVSTYGAIIHSLSTTGIASELRAAIELVDEMEQGGMKTNEVIYTSIIQGFLKGMRNISLELEDGEVIHPYLKAALALRSRMDSRNIPMNRIGYNAIIDAALYINSPIGNQLAMSTFQELQSKLSAKSSNEREADSSGEIGGRAVSSADTFYILLNGFAQNGDWSNARGVLRVMDEQKFIVKSNNLKKLVDKVVRGYWN